MKRKMVIVVPGLTQEHSKAISAAADAHGFIAEVYPDPASAIPFLSNAEIIFGTGAEMARYAPVLRWFCTPQAGVNDYLIDGLFASKEAVLSNCSGAYGTTIAEHIVMVTLELMRRQMEYTEIIYRHEWKRDLPIRSIKNSRITLLGTGDIGQETAMRLRAFSPAKITGVNRSGRNPKYLFDEIVLQTGLDDVLPETDLLIMSLPGTKETDHMMNKERLRLLPRESFIVNVGRGNSLDQRALEVMLRSGELAGAALDVFDVEPLPPEDSLWSCPRLLITPHTAGYITLAYTVDRTIELFLEDFENYCADRPLLRQVDRTLGY